MKYSKIYLLILFMFTNILAGMIKPQDSANLNYTHVLFEWDQIADAVEYEIQISDDEFFNSILISALL